MCKSYEEEKEAKKNMVHCEWHRFYLFPLFVDVEIELLKSQNKLKKFYESKFDQAKCPFLAVKLLLLLFI